MEAPLSHATQLEVLSASPGLVWLYNNRRTLAEVRKNQHMIASIKRGEIAVLPTRKSLAAHVGLVEHRGTKY